MPHRARQQRNDSRIEKRTLDSFSTIARPSDNYWHNTETFYYRLSELIFGSLLASYILGFIAFAPIHLHAPTDGTPNFISKAFVDALTGESFGFWAFLQSILTSVLYSSFTALLYVNFHQSIVYMAIDQRKASYDFFIAIIIGITFGISLAFPLSTIFWLGVMTLFAFLRKTALLYEYARHVCLEVARAAGWVIPPGTSPYDEKIRQEMVAVIMPQLKAALATSNSRVAKSWGHVGAPSVWAAIGAMVCGPFGIFVSGLAWGVGDADIHQGFPNGAWWLAIANLGACTLTFLIFAGLLFQAGRIMPSKEEMDQEVLDRDLNEILEGLRDGLKTIGKRWQASRSRAGQIRKADTPSGSG